MNPRRALYIVLAVLAYVGMIVWIYYEWWKPHSSYQYQAYGIISPDRSVWVQLPIILGLLTVGIVFTCLACSSNVYRIKAGVIVNHQFIRAHDVHTTTGGYFVGSSYVNGAYNPGVWMPRQTITTHVPDRYRLQLRREDGRTGWNDVTVGQYQTPNKTYIDLRGR